MHLQEHRVLTASPTLRIRKHATTLTFMLIATVAGSTTNGDWWPSTKQVDVHFDVRRLAQAVQVNSSQNLQIDVMVSAMTPTLAPSPMDQWTIQITPRDELSQVADYTPRTQLASQLAGPIDVKSTDEQSKSFGINAVGGYGPGHADAGLDQGRKSIHSTSFQKLAPMKAVIASGTIDRGRGVFFKLRAAEQQVLEGEKRFSITLSVPPTWRGDLLDIKIRGERQIRPFNALSDDIQNVGEAHFVVATYRSGDVEAETWARNLAASEDNLHKAVRRFRNQEPNREPVTGLLYRFANKLDITAAPLGNLDQDDWVQRLISGKADPYTDRDIKKLPVNLRVVAIDYCDQVRGLDELRPRSSGGSKQYVSAKIPMTRE